MVCYYLFRQEELKMENIPTATECEVVSDSESFRIPENNRVIQKFQENDEMIEEFDTENEDGATLSGKRIVDINYFINQLQTFNKHGPFGCNISDMKLISEKRKGLISGITMKCSMCNYTATLWTEDLNDNKNMNTNSAAVAGIVKIGGGFANLEEFMSTLNIPPMSLNTFSQQNDKISDAWELTAIKEMEIAANEEKEIAIERGDVDLDGIPLLTVIVDGSWAKRSYKTNYASLSGVVSIFFSNYSYN